MSEFNKIKNIEELNKALKENDLPIKIRKQLQKINTCVWYYGKYINAFKDSLANSYQLTRVTMKENTEDITITEKEDIDADEALKKEEILSLGLLSKFILDTNLNVNQDKKKIIISKRSLGNDTSFLYKEIDLSNNNEIIKTEYLLDELQVIKLSRIHPPKVRIEKNIYRFVYDNQIFEIESCDGKYLLRVINKDPNKPVKLPKGLYSLDKVDERVVEEAMPIFYRSRYLK